MYVLNVVIHDPLRSPLRIKFEIYFPHEGKLGHARIKR